MDAHVTKPVEAARLLEVIEGLVPKAHRSAAPDPETRDLLHQLKVVANIADLHRKTAQQDELAAAVPAAVSAITLVTLTRIVGDRVKAD